MRSELLAAQPRHERSRPATNPGGQECNECGCIFIGAEWHALCAVCEESRVKRILTIPRPQQPRATK